MYSQRIDALNAPAARSVWEHAHYTGRDAAAQTEQIRDMT